MVFSSHTCQKLLQGGSINRPRDLLWGSSWHLLRPDGFKKGRPELTPWSPATSWRPAGAKEAPWRHPNGHKMTPKELQIRARAPKIGPRAPKIDPQGAQTDPQTFKIDTLSSKSRPPKLPQSTPWSRFSALCSQLTSGLFVHQSCF